MRKRLVTAAILIALCVLFAIVDAQMWGSATSTLFWLGNISAPYLLLAFISGRVWMRTDRRIAVAAVAGLVATLATLAVFYAWVVWRGEIAPGSVVFAARRYVAGGLLTGPLFGLLGGLSVRTRSWVPTLPLAAAFALEPVAWFVRTQAWRLPGAVVLFEIAAAVAVLCVFRSVPPGSSPRPGS